MIKLRRSLKSNKTEEKGLNQRSHSVKGNKALDILDPPKKVIRALYDYSAQSDLEISFKKGEFFHVVSFEDDPEWYGASNPLTGVRGLVPVSYFQVLAKTERSITNPNVILPPIVTDSTNYPIQTQHAINIDESKSNKQMPLFAVVLYNFKAERHDELSANAGESLLIIAQSNEEWFVAKPIGRLGGPGLIPVTFCQICDMKTGQVMSAEEVQNMLRTTDRIPTVEKWKQQASQYKKSSISLGKFESIKSEKKKSLPMIRSLKNLSISSTENDENKFRQVKSISVTSYQLEDGQYWFLVVVVWADGSHSTLKRYYKDFYEFQRNLLEKFPIEAGNRGEKRVLPYMPGPVPVVDEEITKQRCIDLNHYFQVFFTLPEYISQDPLVLKLFSWRQADKDCGKNIVSSHRKINTSRISSEPVSNLKMSIEANHSRKRSEGPVIDSVASTKLKIYYRDDLIAIRIPINISYEELFGRINQRLEGKLYAIRWKDEKQSAVKVINSDLKLLEFLESGQKMILYAY